LLGSSPSLEDESWLLDGLGRIVQHTVAMPSNVSSTVVTTLNALGWKISESVPSSIAGAKTTKYQDYDPFGRPGIIIAADGKPTYFTYHGVRAVVRTDRVWNGTREAPVYTTDEYDGLGRLRKVLQPDGSSTRYAYDAGGRLAMVTSLDGARHNQMRTFHYDGRGFLTRETQPERTGATTYQYDAQGNVTKKVTPTGTLFSTYDEAGRLLLVSSPQTTLKQFSYGSAGTVTGKLIEAQSFNWRTAASACTQFEVRQGFSYDGVTGRLSAEDTSLWQGGALEKWTQGYAYDGAGKVTTVSYPNCLSLCTSTSRQVTTAHTLGRPTSVSGFASAITYSGNGTLATIQHANGVLFTEMPDPSGMPRPGSLRADLSPGQPPWPREDYFYDGTGNIKAIGGKSFAYDVASRIVAATVPTAVAQPYQAYAYDGFGNLATIYRGTSPANVTFIAYTADLATNRLLGATYDDAGELTGVPGTTFNWTWDVLGQATSVTTDTESWIHTYDAAGERVWSWRISPSRLDTYALRGQDQKLLSLFTKTGTTYTWKDYAYREGMVLGAAYSTGTMVHFDVDHLGSVRLETASGVQPSYRDLWPYGDEATPPGSSERMRFAGQERDLGSLTSIADDIDYMHARYYRPLFGRFLSPDSAAGDPKVPQGWNRYSYVQGKPVIAVDPTGRVLEVLGKAGDVQDFIGILDSGLYGQVVTISPNGLVAIQSNGEQGPATQAESRLAELIQGIIDDPATTHVTVSSNSTTAMIANAKTHELDVADIKKFGNGPGPTQSSVLAHELVEQYGIQVKGADYQKAHQKGLQAEAYINGFTRSREEYNLPSGRILTTYTGNGQAIKVLLIYANNNIISIERLR
jgi:RHS repeat-associated protein